jgi:two-component system, sensor histidine kinase PdtaS
VTSPTELARTHTGLDLAARAHLERLMASWSLLSDFSFSDLVLYVPVDEYSLAEGTVVARSATSEPPTPVVVGLHFVVLGQIRPTTSQTLFDLDLVGQIVAAREVPLVTECWQRAERTGVERSDRLAQYQCLPVRWNGEVIAVLLTARQSNSGRRAGALERSYMRLFEQLAAMVIAGRYPFVVDDAPTEEAPRVGDGVIVLDADRRISFASPNAVSALHRMGIVTAIVGARLSDLGVDTTAVDVAFDDHAPGVDELERRPDVVVVFRTIPLLSDETVTGAVVLLRDVTDVRRRDRLLLSKDAAIREVHHRVKNNLQTISSLLRLQSRRLEHDSARVALLEAERRIQAIALVHEILARDPGEQVPFAEIVPSLVRLALESNVSQSEIAVEVQGDAGDLIADVATPLAVVIAELLQNAVEHGFVGKAGAAVELRFADLGADLEVVVSDNGVGFPDDFDLEHTTSLGLAIVRDLVRSQLEGSITLSNDNGARVRLVVPRARRDDGAAE